MPWLAPAAAVLLAALTALLTPAVLRALPEPTSADAEGKPPYRSLATPRFVAAVAVAAAASALIAFSWTPPPHWLAWAALAGVNVIACAVDARTTWLPARLSWAGWGVAALGAGAVAVAAGSWVPLLAAAAGAAAFGGFFHLVWRFTGAFGYGDVRLAATIGAVTVLDSVGLAAWSAVLGTLAGAALGVVHRARGGRGPFAYGPGLLAGPFAALLVRALAG